MKSNMPPKHPVWASRWRHLQRWKTGRGKCFRWKRKLDIKSSVWNILIQVFVKHPSGWSNEHWLDPFLITAIKSPRERSTEPLPSPEGHWWWSSALEGGSLWLSDTTGHCYPGLSDGEAPEPTVRVTTMAKVLPIRLPGLFIVPPTNTKSTSAGPPW